MEFAFRTSARPPAINGTPKHRADKTAYFIAELGSGVSDPVSNAVSGEFAGGADMFVAGIMGAVVAIVVVVFTCDGHTGDEISDLRSRTNEERVLACSDSSGT
jgi:hypothetical protein